MHHDISKLNFDSPVYCNKKSKVAINLAPLHIDSNKHDWMNCQEIATFVCPPHYSQLYIQSKNLIIYIGRRDNCNKFYTRQNYLWEDYLLIKS